jgi:hypothetical protein
MRLTLRFRAAVGVLLSGIVASGCSQSPSAPSPSQAAASPTSSSAEPIVMAQAPGLSLEHLAAQGWDCRPAPFNPIRVTCSPPNHPHPLTLPGPPPPADRPAAITLRVFDSGEFAGTSLLIRSDLYNGQTCRWTGGLYNFIGRIGYYECLHPHGGV